MCIGVPGGDKRRCVYCSISYFILFYVILKYHIISYYMILNSTISIYSYYCIAEYVGLLLFVYLILNVPDLFGNHVTEENPKW